MPSNTSILKALELPCLIEFYKKNDMPCAKNGWVKLQPSQGNVQKDLDIELYLKTDFATNQQIFCKTNNHQLGAQINDAKQLEQAANLGFDFAVISSTENELLSILKSPPPIPLFYSKHLENWREIGLHGYMK